MKTEKSCGAVVFTVKNDAIRYIVVQSKEGFYGFPKGHAEGSETEIETALREIAEETGLSTDIVDGFRTEDSHPFTKNGEPRMKHIVYFLAEYSNQIPVAQEAELNSIRSVDYDTAMNLFQFESSKRILSEAHCFLTQNQYITKKQKG